MIVFRKKISTFLEERYRKLIANYFALGHRIHRDMKRCYACVCFGLELFRKKISLN